MTKKPCEPDVEAMDGPITNPPPPPPPPPPPKPPVVEPD